MIALSSHALTPTPKASQKHAAHGDSIEAMNRLTRIKCEPPRLYESATGAPLDFYNEFTEYLWGEIGTSYARNSAISLERGGRVFSEFLYETGALSGRLDPVTASKTMQLFSSYLIDGADAKDPIVRQAFIRTGRKKISTNSAGQYIAGANLLLNVCSTITFEQAEMISVLTDLPPQTQVNALPELDSRVRSPQELARIHANTLQVKPTLGAGAKKARGGLRAPKKKKDRKAKHIAVPHILPMLENAPTPLDGLIWSFGLGSLRVSETMGFRLEDVDVHNKLIRVEDPKGLRDTTNKESFGYKGRKTAVVTMFEPFKSIFWQKLAEYMAVRPSSNSPWLLLSLDKKTYGVPLCELKSSSVNRAINRSIQATQNKLEFVAPQGEYSSHQFRHLFGVWAYNYVVVPGRPKPGLDLPEIQLLMGHADLKSTEIYAVDLGIHTLVEVDAANELIYHRGAGESIDYYRGQAYARLSEQLLQGPEA
ncbi:integrase [Pseudomonas syringae group genomosp. 3]|uniref:Integrase n=1 Tax=Pseudomonas syringae group genomosp. 3 TaxID=251701 RepID=A0A2K4WIQ8_9PSED|nr:site-specific integrase [Pseudomonas syringae group genomosp. 3]SOS35765.1 integrase [Pseudomonas syringae group genomosp. 3]